MITIYIPEHSGVRLENVHYLLALDSCAILYIAEISNQFDFRAYIISDAEYAELLVAMHTSALKELRATIIKSKYTRVVKVAFGTRKLRKYMAAFVRMSSHGCLIKSRLYYPI